MLRELWNRAFAFAEGGKVDLGHAFGLPPKKAVEYFERKGYSLDWDWWQTYEEAHRKAFAVAKVTRMDVLQDIRAAVAEIFTEGVTEATFRRRLEPKLKVKGWWGRQDVADPEGRVRNVQLGSPHRLRTIYRTNAQSALAAGRWQEFAANADKRPYLQYIAVLDNRTRPAHRLLHGKVFRIDDPIWKFLAPPNGWGCRCRLRALSYAEMVEKGLKLSDSSGLLTEVQALVSQATGELRPVMRYTDPKTGQTMTPDPGFNYNPGNYNPGLGRDATPEKRRDPDLVAAKEEVVRASGLAARFPVQSVADINPLLKAYHQEHPGNFQLGFMSITERSSRKYLLQTTKYGKIDVSNVTQSGLNPARNLTSALGKIGKGQALDLMEEYAIEGLWHEIGHCRSKGWMNTRRIDDLVMETLNQWVARHTYGEFMSALGGKAIHQERVLAEGLGYQSMVRNFRALLSRVDADEQAALGLLRPLSVESQWADLISQIPDKLAGLKGDPALAPKIKRGLYYLQAQTPQEFNTLLDIVFGARP